MIFIDKRLQPVYTVVLDCPGKDSIRLWPLPMVDPWVERRKAALYLQVGEKKTRRLVGRWKFSVSNTLVHIIENLKDLRIVANFGEIFMISCNNASNNGVQSSGLLGN